MHIRVDDLRGAAIQKLLQVHLDAMHSHSPPESVHALDIDALRQTDVTFWTVWSDGELLGCGALKQLGAQFGEIKSMRTAIAWRGCGVAGRVLGHIVQVARERGYATLGLETGSAPAFQPARSLYERFGFSYCGPFEGYAEDPNSVFMQRAP